MVKPRNRKNESLAGLQDELKFRRNDSYCRDGFQSVRRKGIKIMPQIKGLKRLKKSAQSPKSARNKKSKKSVLSAVSR